MNNILKILGLGIAMSLTANVNAAIESSVEDAIGNNVVDDASLFPAVERSYLKQVKRYELDDVLRLSTGVNKDQVRHLLGNPHFNEGLFARVWNYVLDIRIPNTQNYQRCELRVDYDQKNFAERLSWQDETCRNFLSRSPAPTIPTPVAEPAPIQIQRFSLNADALFRFDGGDVADLLPQGRVELDEFLQQINGMFTNIDQINLFGYTDYLGSESYNYSLGLRRAETVKQYMVNYGIPSNIINAKSLGETSPVTANCSTTNGIQALRRCLQPDRRVEIEISGSRRNQ